jgi:phosphate:Na+ symporter
LVGLVFFQSFVNLAGILLFFPFLNKFAALLEKLFTKNDADTFFIHKVSSENTDLALEAFEKESRYFLNYVIQYSLDIFKLQWPQASQPVLSEKFKAHTLTEKYNFIKHLHGELLAYYIDLQNNSSEKQEVIRLDKILSSVRNSMYAAKSMKDALPDASMLRNSSNDQKYDFYLKACKKIETFYIHLLQVMEKPAGKGQLKKLSDFFKEVQDGYAVSLKELYQRSFREKLDEIEISSIINFNRQLYTAFKSMGLSVKDYFLDEKEAEYFDALPGFIH